MTATTKTIRLRASEEVRDVIDRGAAAVHKSRSQFILEASAVAAQNALLDRTYFALSPVRMAEFERVMDHPLAANHGLSALLAHPRPLGAARSAGELAKAGAPPSSACWTAHQ